MKSPPVGAKGLGKRASTAAVEEYEQGAAAVDATLNYSVSADTEDIVAAAKDSQA